MISLLLALSPVILIIIILLAFRKPLAIAAPITYVFTLLLTLSFWKMFPAHAAASTLKGVLVGIDIAIIIFGAIFFLEYLKESKLLLSIEYYLSALSADRRVQAIIIAWLFGSFLEGSAGFGTPAATVAPLLVGIGFPAITSVIIALISNSTPVVFGAVGTPIRIGLSGLDAGQAPHYAAFMNMFLGILVPVMLLVVLVVTSKNRSFKAVYECIPFALWSGISFTLPYFLFSKLGYEFPSLLGSLVGIAVVCISTRLNFLTPKNIWTFGSKNSLPRPKDSIIKAASPYLIFSLLLIGAKYILPSFPVSLAEGITHSINFYNPGFIFLITAFIVAAFYKPHSHLLLHSANVSIKMLFRPFISVFFIVAFVQLMVNSGFNPVSMPGMIETIASIANTKALPFIAPFIGAFGAFIAGSCTVSTLLFGKFQVLAAQNLGMSTSIILALQLIGGGVGNMIALTNIVAAEATVHLHHKEEKILKTNIIPCLIYLIAAGLFGLILIYL